MTHSPSISRVCLYFISIISVNSFLSFYSVEKGINFVRSRKLNMSKYNSVLVALDFPNTFNIVLQNDEILAKSVKGIKF